MSDLEIFVFKQKAVTDSRDVAHTIGRPHKQLMRSIQTLIGHMEHANTERKNAPSAHSKVAGNGHMEHANNGRQNVPVEHSKIAVSDFFIPSTYIDESGRTVPCYLCTRLGCDLIANKMTGEKGTLFTVAYVSKFRAMETELIRRELQRTVKAPVRRRLTDAIRDSGENERMCGHAYAAYTNLIYKAAVGKTAAQLRKEGGQDVLSLLDADALEAITKRESQVCTLLDCGMNYAAIRAVLIGSMQKIQS